MGRETGFNRKNKPYIVQQRRKIADKKRNNTRPPATVLRTETVSDKKKRREEKKLAIKIAKKDQKRKVKSAMSLEEDGAEDNGGMECEM